MGWIDTLNLAVMVEYEQCLIEDIMADEIWFGAGNNPSLRVNIVPGQGDTKSLVGLQV